MKKIIKHAINEIAKYYCDKHPDRECYSELKLSSWYGSKFDLNSIEIHLCDECLEEVYKFLKKKFKVKSESLYD